MTPPGDRRRRARRRPSAGEGEIAHEHDQIKEGREEDRVSGDREKQRCARDMAEFPFSAADEVSGRRLRI